MLRWLSDLIGTRQPEFVIPGETGSKSVNPKLTFQINGSIKYQLIFTGLEFQFTDQFDTVLAYVNAGGVFHSKGLVTTDAGNANIDGDTSSRVYKARFVGNAEYAYEITDGVVSCGYYLENVKGSAIQTWQVDGTTILTATTGGVTFPLSLISQGAASFQGTATFAGDVFQSAVVTTANVSTNPTHNWNPGIETNVRFTCSASVVITGLAGGTNNRQIRLWNIGTNAATLAHESASSTSTNRFICPGLANFTLRAGGGVELWYDQTSQRWRILEP